MAPIVFHKNQRILTPRPRQSEVPPPVFIDSNNTSCAAAAATKILCFKRPRGARGLLLPAAGIFFLQGVACFGVGSPLISRTGAGAASAARRASSPGLRSAANGMAKESWEREVTGVSLSRSRRMRWCYIVGRRATDDRSSP